MQNETRLLPSARHKEEAHKSSGSTRYQNLFSSILALPLLAHVFPSSLILNAARAVTIDGAGIYQVAPDLAYLALTALAFLAFGAWSFRWRID